MAIDTSQLALTVASELPVGRLRKALVDVAGTPAGSGILERLNLMGRAIARSVSTTLIHPGSAFRLD